MREADFDTRAVLQGRCTSAAADDPSEVWWLLLDCGCTLSCPYQWGAPVYRRMHCPEHPERDSPPPKDRGRDAGEAWLKVPHQPEQGEGDGEDVDFVDFGMKVTTVEDPPGSPAPTTIMDALDELIDKLKRERTP